MQYSYKSYKLRSLVSYVTFNLKHFFRFVLQISIRLRPEMHLAS